MLPLASALWEKRAAGMPGSAFTPAAARQLRLDYVSAGAQVYISALLKASDQGPDAKPWVATSVSSVPSQCAGRSQGCVVCTTPAAGVLLSALFALVYGASVLRLRTEMRRVVLNRVSRSHTHIATGGSCFVSLQLPNYFP